MNGSVNHPHYNVEKQSAMIQKFVADNVLPWPCFVGQGCTYSIGSDSYGRYVTYVGKLHNGKPLIGLSHANEVMHEHWTEGSMDCSIDIDNAKPTMWITTYGKFKNGNPKWWFCDDKGCRKNKYGYSYGKCKFSWNGAYAYRDPSL